MPVPSLSTQRVDRAYGSDDEERPRLPPHQRCSAHTFNLIGSKDVDAAIQKAAIGTADPGRRGLRKALAKAAAFFNKYSRTNQACLLQLSYSAQNYGGIKWPISRGNKCDREILIPDSESPQDSGLD